MKTIYEADVQQLTIGLASVGIPIAAEATPVFTCTLSCHLYLNPDGSICWLWPVGADRPDFLRFYRCSRRRDQLFTGLVRGLFDLNRGHWVAQDRLTLYTTAEGYQLFRRFQINRWALAMGTPGPRRTLTLWYSVRNETSYFLKIALTSSAVTTLCQEALTLRRAERMPFLNLATSRLKTYHRGVLVLDDIGFGEERQSNRVSDLPINVLLELLTRRWQMQPLQQTQFWQQAHETLRVLRAKQDNRIPIGLLDKVDALMHSLDADKMVTVADAHGDFTPRNILIRNGRLVVGGWSLYGQKLPGLYDLFYFLYQPTEFAGKQNFNLVRRQVDAVLNQPEWQSFRERYQLDIEMAEVLFLLHTVTDYLGACSRWQGEWTLQTYSLFTTWNEALTYWLRRKAILSDRQLLLVDVGIWLHQRPYAALKYLPSKLNAQSDSSDLDLCMPQPVASQLVSYIRQHASTDQLIMENRSFMRQLSIKCVDNSSLQIDLIWAFKQKYLECMAADAVWKQATLIPSGLKVPSPEVQLSYRRLYYGPTMVIEPERYKRLSEEPEGMFSPHSLANEIRLMPQNRGLRGIRNRLSYVWDSVRAGIFRRGSFRLSN